ncbi:DUF4157 domain-containing protein [Flavobacterium sp. LM4]|uniref:eCIS core domain-containing protein n=1 Tax=Flavobacterium sp. LM4 TaxID=1938609 RepID=UPI0009921813|nr:DUF4157 domain-containing protein [Flavobacterium sp. LM4]
MKHLYKKNDTELQSSAANLNNKTIQNKAKTLQDNRSTSIIQKKGNNTGLPDNLKSGIENLSGHSMDDVKVHYNSEKPAQLNAHAYAQGTDIHIGSGQEKHLPHEAWHVIQQKQGRVKPTLQMKGKVNVNDDKGLENEADVMGSIALQNKQNNDEEHKNGFANNTHKTITQKKSQEITKNNQQNQKFDPIRNVNNNYIGVIQMNKSQKKRAAKKRAAKKRAIREYQERQDRLASEKAKSEQQKKQDRLASEKVKSEQQENRKQAIYKFPTASQSERDQILREHYKIEPNLTQQEEINSRRFQATEFGFNKTKKNLPGSNLKMGKWHGGKEEIIGGHHKLPKRTLGFLYSKMTEPQKKIMREKLHLNPLAGHKALAKLRSNIIPRGEKEVAPEMREDDADHEGDVDEANILDKVNAEGVDTVTDESGSMTPRSRTYVSLAAHAKQIQERLQNLQEENMSDEEARKTISHLRRAEVLHHKMEGSLGAADYGKKFWQKTRSGKYVKGRAITRNPKIHQSDEDNFDKANEDRKEAEKEAADRSAQEKREAEERIAQEERLAKEKIEKEKKDKEFDARHAGHYMGKSARLW